MSVKYQLNPSTVSLYTEKMIHQILSDPLCFGSEFRHNEWQHNDVASALGLPSELEQNNDIDFRKTVRTLLDKRFQQIKDMEYYPENESIKQGYENIQFLHQLLGLTDAEVKILYFAFHLKVESPLVSLFYCLEKKDFSQSCQFLANILMLPLSDVKMALKKQGKLLGYNLLERDFSPDQVHEFVNWGELIEFDDFVTQPLTSENVLQRCVKVTEKPNLTWQHFEHMDSMRQTMLNYLQHAIKSAKKGANILIYGKPGTGKTEFSALLGEMLNLSSYTIEYMDEDDDALKPVKRLVYSRLAQKLLGSQRAIVIFDEIEDVFSHSLFERSVAQTHKAWTNNLLETNQVPMIWLSNDVSCMDAAFIRRFDIVFQMPDLPISHKEILIKKLVGEHLSTEYIHYFAKVRSLSPAILDRTFTVVNQLQQSNPEQDFVKQAITLLNQTLQAQGHKKIQPFQPNQLNYNLDYVACSTNIYQVSAELTRTKRGRICCYGPPGTGKTAWANWLAEQCGMPALVKKGSDLLDKFVGRTEQNIADAFEEAKEKEMVLILDEVDSFLFTRENGQRSWEHSLVNEMLTQIESFDGLLVVSTNLMDNLDPAALRRFDLKLHFDYLKPEQSQKLAKDHAKKLGLSALTDTNLKTLEILTALTPGDFTAVARRHRFAPFERVDDWLNALKEECNLKQVKVNRKIGF